MNEPSLTEFLLARIAEDEESIPEWRERVVPGSPIGDWILRIGDRVLAECEAKRRIIGFSDGLFEYLDAECASIGISAPDPDYLLDLLALPYADHPDYREEWRP